MAGGGETEHGYQKQAPLKGILWMAVAAVFFSISMGLVRHISLTIDAFEQTFFRQFLGMLIMLPFMLRGGFASFRTGQLKTNLIRNVAGYLGISMSFWAVTLIPLADATALQFTLPLFTIIFAMILLAERVGRHRWIATVIGFAGALVIIRPGFAEINLGMVVALAAAASFGISDTLARRLSRTDSTNSIVFFSFALQVPIALAVALFNWVTPSLADWPWLIALGLASFGAQWSLSRSFVLAEASLVSPVLFFRLPMVAVIGFFFFDELSDIWTWIGAAIIFSATYYSARREASHHRAKQAA
ncbi:MAG: DMT family transporter [Rhodospirillales bacterium]|nr:DMT family transporter [Rhodospirillales bacterium]MDP6643587.1 DMT family transporter [Rhodospirillales bacterium]MDP6841006.1 DMT family transporter [Rhodospirillales bacterium]